MAASLLAPGVARAGQRADNYIIGPKDVLTITVWTQTDMSGKFAVESDGSFSFPLVGRVKAAGLTLRELEADLKKRLAAEYFTDPQLSVAVEDYRSQRIFLTGEVRTPGAYPLTGDMTLIEALARAGSTTPGAGSEAVVIRAAAAKPPAAPVLPAQAQDAEVIRIDLRELQEGRLAGNIVLRDGDTVFVPRAELIYVYGQVKNPGGYALQTRDTTVQQALALAGGLTPRGSSSRIKITRLVDGKRKDIRVKLTDVVRPGDTIIVPERFY